MQPLSLTLGLFVGDAVNEAEEARITKHESTGLGVFVLKSCRVRRERTSFAVVSERQREIVDGRQGRERAEPALTSSVTARG